MGLLCTVDKFRSIAQLFKTNEAESRERSSEKEANPVMNNVNDIVILNTLDIHELQI